MVVTFLEEKGDWPERFEFGFPISSAMPWWWGRFCIAKAFLVVVGAIVVCVAADFHYVGDHVSVGGSFVPEPPQAVKALAELGIVGVNVGGVGGGEGETYPRGASARSWADGVDDG